MTTFQDLQAEHEALLNRQEAPADPEQFWADVQHYIDRVCVEAAHISAPRERDQLRAILRFWASYVFDQTGTYPDTTLRPAMSKETSASPPSPGGHVTGDVTGDVGSDKAEAILPPPEPKPSSLKRVLIVVGALAACIIIVVISIPAILTNAPPIPIKATPNVLAPNLTEALGIESTVITGGPSPFDPTVWVVRLQLSAKGGDGKYIFWVNGQHLPDASANQFTVEGKSCTAETPLVGVTSGGQAVSQQLVISSPLPSCPAP